MTIPRSTDRHVFSPDRYGGVIAPNGAIYGIPQTATGVLKISPGARRADGSVGEDAVTVVGEGTLGEGGWKWHGGVLVGTAIYAFPNNHDRVLKIDTERDALELLEAAGGRLESGRHRVPQDGRYKYLGGAAAGPFVYMFPCDAERVLRVDTRTDEVRRVGPELLQGENKWQVRRRPLPRAGAAPRFVSGRLTRRPRAPRRFGRTASAARTARCTRSRSARPPCCACCRTRAGGGRTRWSSSSWARSSRAARRSSRAA